MKAKKYQFITIFLVLMFCLIGAVSATEDISTDTPSTTTADQTVSTQAVHEDLSEKVSSTTTKTVTDDTPKEKTNKEKIGTTDNTEPQPATNNKTETPTTKPEKNKLKAQNNENTLTETNTEPLKTGTKTVNVNDYTELTEAINNATNDAENNEYIINLNAGTYKINTATELKKGTNTPNIIINANKQTLTADQYDTPLKFNNGCNITINEAHITHVFQNYGNMIIRNSILNVTVPQGFLKGGLTNPGNVTFINSTIDAYIDNSNYDGGICTLTISDDSIIGEKFECNGNGQIIINDTNKIAPYLSTYDGDYTLENMIIDSMKTNNGNLTIKNSTINNYIMNNGNLTIKNSTINNYIMNNGKLIIENDVIFGENGNLMSWGGEVIINNSNSNLNNPSLLPYLSIYEGDVTLTDVKITTQKINYGNLTLINCEITETGLIKNQGTLELKNTKVNGQIDNQPVYNGYLIIADDVTFGPNTVFTGGWDGKISMNNTSRIVPYLTQFNGTYTIENFDITKEITNHANLTIINSTIDKALTNNGKLIFINNTRFTQYYYGLTNNGELFIENITINSTISNNGVLTIGENVTFGEKFSISGDGKVIAQDINKVFPYITTFTGNTIIELGITEKTIYNKGNLTIENSTFNNLITNYAKSNLTLINSTINGEVYNSGILTLKNVTINSTIQNDGVIIISDDTKLTDNSVLNGNGEIIINDTQRIVDYLTIYTGNIILNNKTITTDKINKGSLTLVNCTLNSTIKNEGSINISDDTIIGENAKITGTGEIVTNDITKLLPIIDTINGNYVIKDTSLTKSYIFNGEITLNNCTITNPDNTNFGKLTLTNCTVDVGEDNTFLTNYGTVYISKDTKINGKITGNEEEVFYDVTKIYNINSGSIDLYFEENGLNSIIRPGDTLKFQGNILLTHDLIIDTPVNINSENAYINGNQIYNFTITEDGAYTNITGISFNNTKILINAKYVTIENTNINGTIKLDGSNNTITNNKIITDDEYTITSTIGQNNTITDNYLVAKTLIGDKTVNLKDASNIIENNIPLNVKIEITVNPENTVNKTTTIIIVLKDENDNLIANQKVNLTIGSSTQEVDLKNGFILYTYTPETIGEDTVTVKYNGDGIYLPATNDTILNVTADKDKIIQALEEANETNTQRISDLNKEITNKTETIKKQDSTIQNQTETIKTQDSTIQSQTQQITEANNKAAVAEQKANQATVPIKKVKASKTVKKSKNFKIKVTLKKAVKGKKVFVIFNGKTYTKKTNKKGIATITIKKSALKKALGKAKSKKVKYQIISGEKIVKKTVKVKK